MSLLLALALLQQGPFTIPGNRPVSPLRRELQDRRPPTAAPVPRRVSPPAAEAVRLGECLVQAENDPTSAMAAARLWRDQATAGVERSLANHCLANALVRLERWSEAETAFLAARAAASGDRLAAARFAAMAANAALAGGNASRALATLDAARVSARGDAALTGAIELDRARALVALKREGEAAGALEQARNALPRSPEAWLLSATLSRRLGKLAEAQTQIERAGALLPTDPDIGLEAGVIAMLAGREEPARKSWQSVIAANPESAAAKSANAYLVQLGTSGPGGR